MASVLHVLWLLLMGFYSIQSRIIRQHVNVEQRPTPKSDCRSGEVPKVPKLPESDGNLHVYALPVGQGDAHVIQCPDGALAIIDMGTLEGVRKSDEYVSGFWEAEHIRQFFGDQIKKIETMSVSHNHWDHYSLYPEVFRDATQLTSLRHMYISCLFDNMNSAMKSWIAKMSIRDKVTPFNNGSTCGINNVPCQTIDVCPKSPQVTTKVLSANLGQHCKSGNKNIDSIVFKLVYKSVSVLFTGDFEDETRDWNEEGPQRKMLKFYGHELIPTIYQMAHHGASRLANKPIWTNNIRPKALFVSSNPWYSNFRHPRCSVIDAFIKYVKTLCKPKVTNPSDPFYCGPSFTSSTSTGARIQRFYTCGTSVRSRFTEVANNEYAFYDTVPNQRMIQLVHMKTDGTRWGFDNKQSKRIQN